MNALKTFCRQVRARSAEHREALHLLHTHHLYGLIVSILRQELDSMIRVIYLLSIQDRAYRNQLIQAAVDGKPWTHQGRRLRITDREMVDLAQRLQGWTESVYRFGCAFIHLSRCHDYGARDPVQGLSSAEQADLVAHLRRNHGGPPHSNVSFEDLLPYLPSVFHKIADNLESYVQLLEAEDDLDQ
jgi:hypothetical protein